ncbi:hypothetical protein ACSBR2_035925 [Camellia fascicularis]
MPRKRLPIFQKKPIKLAKKYKLLQYYNYDYIQEYQFSSSRTPLLYYHIKPFKKRNYRDKSANLFMCQCLGKLRVEREGYIEITQYWRLCLPLKMLWQESCRSFQTSMGKKIHLMRGLRGSLKDAVARELSKFSNFSGKKIHLMRGLRGSLKGFIMKR